MSSHPHEGKESFSSDLANRPRTWSSQLNLNRDLKHELEKSEDNQRDVLIDSGFTGLGVSELLAVDPRPTFVCKVPTITNDVFEIVFANHALRAENKLWKSIQKASGPKQVIQSTAPEILPYRKWLESIAKQDVSRPESMAFSECDWNAFVVEDIWLVVGGSRNMFSETRPQSVSSTRSSTSISSQTGSDGNIQLKQQNERTNSFESSPNDTITPPSYITPGTPDWTLRHPKGDLAPHVIFTRSIDWARTPLGDMNSWSREFRQVVNLVMANPHPAALFWGDELTVMYNKAYADTVAGDKHPKLMGMGFSTNGAFREIWDFVGPIFKKCRSTGKSVAVSEQNLPMEHNGFLEETFFSWSLTPLYGGTSKILGLYNAPFETTAKSRAVRATQTLLKLGQELNKAQTISDFWQRILRGIEDNGYDFPFAIIYSVEDEFDGGEEDSSSASVTSMDLKVCVLEGVLGVPEGHPAAPTRLDLKRSRGGFIPSFRDAMRTREPKLLNILDGTLSEPLLEGIEWRGYGEPCRSALVCPIRPTNGENVMGFLVIGVNPRRRYDEDYSALVRLLDRQLATSLASVTLFEAEIQRGVEAAQVAAAERSRLSRELEVQRTRLQRMAEISAVGMFSIDPEGHILEANDRWYEMTGHPRGDEENHDTSFMEGIHQGSIEVMKSGWARLTVDKLPWSGELQMKKRWNDPNTGDEVDYWILLAAQPEFSLDGRFLSFMGSITDITLQKQSEKVADMRTRFTEKLLAQEQETKDLQRSQLEEAEENRRRQNNFIDITSHEMRNPLSAILQCADSIATSLKDTLRDSTKLDPSDYNNIEAAVESAETIQLCKFCMPSTIAFLGGIKHK
jgi:PAS domain S-box-containing protein